MTKTNTNHVAFFKTFFGINDDDTSYMEREVNGWYLIRHWDGNKQGMTVDIYSPESYRNYQKGRAKFNEQKEQMDFLKSL